VIVFSSLALLYNICSFAKLSREVCGSVYGTHGLSFLMYTRSSDLVCTIDELQLCLLIHSAFTFVEVEPGKHVAEPFFG
jgi:hypothetical protein